MLIKVRTFNTTQFSLYWSHVNQCFIFHRKDVGTDTEIKLLSDCKNEPQATEYFNSRIAFFCEVLGINEDCMIKG